MAGREVGIQWHRLHDIQRLRRATTVNEHFFNAITLLSREREVTYALLQANDVARIESLQPDMVQSRAEVDMLLQTVTQELSQYPLEADSPARGIGTQYAVLHTIREQVDHALAQPHPVRNTVLATRWFATSTDVLNRTFDGWMGFTRDFTEIDPIVTQRMMFQHFLGLIIR